MMNYEQFLEGKLQLENSGGFDPVFLPSFLFDFQAHLVEKALKAGRYAVFAECGLGKTAIELVWAENIFRKTGRRVLIATPLAVAPQFVQEGEKFGIKCEQSKTGRFTHKIVICNYERLHYFNPDDFSGFVADESAVLKNFDGKTKAAVTEFMRRLPYRLLGTATPAPNDYVELGTSSEALGYLGYMDMLSKFFKNDQNSNHPNRLFSGDKWRFRGYAERDFWRWVSSWARAIRKPSDLGFDDGLFILPPLTETQHVIKSATLKAGTLIPMAAHGLSEQREERRRTLTERCELAAELCISESDPSIAWCHLIDEGDLLEKLIPGSVQVKGSDSIDFKEEALSGFRLGHFKKLVSKTEIAGFGLNYQHCAHQIYFPSHSFEQYYQGIRRSWRFGQKNAVQIDIVTSEGESSVLKNLQRKNAAADRMFQNLISSMNEALGVRRTVHAHEGFSTPSFL